LNPLEMFDSALGIGKLAESNRMPVQTEFGAPEAGGVQGMLPSGIGTASIGEDWVHHGVALMLRPATSANF
ncbi:MAG: hypothetical protein ACKOAH_27555, partial [Pirellula sp.]